MATKNTKSSIVSQAQQLIAGTNEHLSNVSSIMLAGTAYTPAQVVQQLQTLINLREDVDAAKAAVKAKLAVETSSRPALRVFLNAMVSFVKGAFGSAPDILADFGIVPKARKPLTVAAQAAATAKRKATRAARHTMGSRQKKSVKGTVTGVVITPVPTPSPEPTPPSPTPVAGGPSATTPTALHTG